MTRDQSIHNIGNARGLKRTIGRYLFTLQDGERSIDKIVTIDRFIDVPIRMKTMHRNYGVLFVDHDTAATVE